MNRKGNKGNTSNGIPENISTQHLFGISALRMKLKDTSYYSIVYQIWIHNQGWLEAKSDDIETKWAIEEAYKQKGPVYVRLSRLATPIIYDENQNFEFGKMIQIGNGIDATIFASGDVLAEALKAKEILAKTKGIDIRVVDVHTIKPIDEDMIVKCAKETKRLISIEDHNVIGGLGSAISEVLTSKYPAKLERIGINDEFGRSGKAEELVEFYGLSAEKIVEKFL